MDILDLHSDLSPNREGILCSEPNPVPDWNTKNASIFPLQAFNRRTVTKDRAAYIVERLVDTKMSDTLQLRVVYQ